MEKINFWKIKPIIFIYKNYKKIKPKFLNFKLIRRNIGDNKIYTFNKEKNEYELNSFFNKLNTLGIDEYKIFIEKNFEIFNNYILNDKENEEYKTASFSKILNQFLDNLFNYKKKFLDVKIQSQMKNKKKEPKYYYYFQEENGFNIFIHDIDQKYLELNENNYYDFNVKIKRYFNFVQNNITKKEFTSVSYLPNNTEIFLVNICLKNYLTVNELIDLNKEVIMFYKKKYKDQKKREKNKKINENFEFESENIYDFETDLFIDDEDIKKKITDKDEFPDLKIEKKENSTNILTEIKESQIKHKILQEKIIEEKNVELNEDENNQNIILVKKVKQKKKRERKKTKNFNQKNNG